MKDYDFERSQNIGNFLSPLPIILFLAIWHTAIGAVEWWPFYLECAILLSFPFTMMPYIHRKSKEVGQWESLKKEVVKQYLKGEDNGQRP